MTEFEIATLAFQEATLAFQESALAIQQSTLAIQESTLAIRRIGLWIAGAHVAVGLGQIAVDAWGIRAMQRAAERRAADAREESLRIATADERRHAETMDRLDRIATADDHRHAEAMQALDLQRQALETLIDGQRTQNAALSTLIPRTAPAGQ